MTKTRNKPDQARENILNVAQLYLMEGGPEAIKVQKIAADMGISDAAIHYHFKNRESLLQALLKHAGKQLKSMFEPAQAPASYEQTMAHLDDVYRTKGYARLAMYLAFAGVPNEGSGMFENWVSQGGKTALKQRQFSIAMLNLLSAAEPLMGSAFLRSVGRSGDDQDRAEFRRWMTQQLKKIND